jgi:quercetin dioxygenase-like cupin family protein
MRSWASRKRIEREMELQIKSSTVKNAAEHNTGDVWGELITSPREPNQHMVVGRVRFAPGARTAWHSHERGQTLHIVAGIALLGSRDGTIIEATPGQTIYTSPGEEHWHGATPTDFMEHFAMLDQGNDPATSNIWFEHVSDSDYHRLRASGSSAAMP